MLGLVSRLVLWLGVAVVGAVVGAVVHGSSWPVVVGAGSLLAIAAQGC